VLEDSPARVERARVLADLGAALRRDGQRRAAREHLRQASELAERCGAHALVAFAEEELAASGARLQRMPLSGVAALTPAERRVATLAATGLTNPQIAQRLFLSVKTVEMHLGRTYRKLDLQGRGELEAALDPA
jgi:DNA-binding CsgD family transcriptional regulator